MEQGLDETLKIVVFHEFLPEMQDVKSLFENRNFEGIMYELRDEETYENLKVMLNAFKNLVVRKK